MVRIYRDSLGEYVVLHSPWDVWVKKDREERIEEFVRVVSEVFGLDEAKVREAVEKAIEKMRKQAVHPPYTGHGEETVDGVRIISSLHYINVHPANPNFTGIFKEWRLIATRGGTEVDAVVGVY